MRSFTLWIFVGAMCLLAEAQANCKSWDGQELTVGTHFINCIQVQCHPDGHVTGLACAPYLCQEGKQIGYREMDVTKSYPECCGGPICAD
ncbi:uncharacterized protein LOC143177854 [Calliopsis andreniformis]|uniref:uncharacterized protein LOC143177854 n=1 Tax=Calliopsis andreniformis TaxID=337506 RepID=UPI003FCDD4C3